jgi:hypothetical protein
MVGGRVATVDTGSDRPEQQLDFSNFVEGQGQQNVVDLTQEVSTNRNPVTESKETTCESKPESSCVTTAIKDPDGMSNHDHESVTSSNDNFIIKENAFEKMGISNPNIFCYIIAMIQILFGMGGFMNQVYNAQLERDKKEENRMTNVTGGIKEKGKGVDNGGGRNPGARCTGRKKRKPRVISISNKKETMGEITEEGEEKDMQNYTEKILLAPLLIDLWKSLGYDGGRVYAQKTNKKKFVAFKDAFMNKFRMDQSVQGDSNEAYILLLGALEEELADFFEGGKEGFKSWVYSFAQRTSQCGGCDYSFPTVDPILVCNLSINRKECINLEDMIRETMTEEQLTEFHCKRENGSRITEFTGTPKILVFQLLIFKMHPMGKLEKFLNVNVNIPRVLNMEKCNTTYKLRGAISHIGDNSHIENNEDNKGHYVAYRRVGDVWLLFDDDCVKTVEFDQIAKSVNDDNETPFMIFYEQMTENPERVYNDKSDRRCVSFQDGTDVSAFDSITPVGKLFAAGEGTTSLVTITEDPSSVGLTNPLSVTQITDALTSIEREAMYNQHPNNGGGDDEQYLHNEIGKREEEEPLVGGVIRENDIEDDEYNKSFEGEAVVSTNVDEDGRLAFCCQNCT